ncbi:Pectin lyase-like superfamily protein [Striga hermonthica]|uniref:Pectate lyase n=1 Tax=Striga hermonthica TaxID=68872 RepID=A0A9N7MUN5_STRHE|nr:Pectin lyase-like superfamily protein [Striga hermonthica]
MAHHMLWSLVWAISIAILTILGPAEAHKPNNNVMNVIDRCWRTNPNWRRNRHQLATCSVGYAGKMTNNIGRAVTNYKVTDPSDDPLNPRPGTLRHAVTSIKGKVWVTFARDMSIKLIKPLLVSSYTTLDGRGVNVHIANGACLYLRRVTDVIIHGLRIHNCVAQGPGPVLGPNRRVVNLGPVDGDAIRMLTSTRVWIDHNTLSDCQDGLIDVTRGSTEITITNNRFKLQNKVMLLGHDDGFRRDSNMRVTVAFNQFGPHCMQRMPRIRFGYAHVVNNLYLGWGQYALGGSMNPSIKSQANLFIAPQGDNKEITWDSSANGRFKSINDVFENGASFKESVDKGVTMRPNYRPDQNFKVSDGRIVRALTSSAGALICPRTSTC